MIRLIHLLSLLIILSVLLAGCDSSTSVRNRMTNENGDYDIFYDETSSLEKVNEDTIRRTLVADITKNIAEIKGFDKVKSALFQLDEKNAGKQLKFKLPADAEKLETGDIKQFLRAYTRLIAVKYCLETRVLFNYDLLYMPFGNYDRTYEQFIYWRWNNCLSSDEIFTSSKLDYSPFTENELSVLYWSNKLIRCNPDKYRNAVASKLQRMQMLEKTGSKYKISDRWLEKINKDLDDISYSKMAERHSLPQPEGVTYSILSFVNNVEEIYMGPTAGRGGGGSVFRYRRVRRKWIGHGDPGPLQRQVPDDTVSRFRNEMLLPLIEIEGLLKSEDIENILRGTMHLFRFMQKNKDYSKIEMLVDLLGLNSPQLAKLIKNEIQSALKKADSKTKKHIKNFIFKLFEKVKLHRSGFLDLALSLMDKYYLDKFVKLLSDYKIFEVKNQKKIIDFIVKNKKTEYISKLFDWRFNSKKEGDFSFIEVEEFFKTMINFNRSKSLQKISSLMQTEFDELSDKVKLGKLFLVETTGVDHTEYYVKKRGIKHAVDAKKLEDNKIYFESAHLYTNVELRKDFYTIVSENCNVNLDQVVYNWFENESDYSPQMRLLVGFAMNVLDFELSSGYLRRKDVDEKNVDIDALRKEIRNNEKRFTTFASYVMQSEFESVQCQLFRIAPYLRADDAWRIIKHFFDFKKTDEKLYYYFDEIDRLYKDSLGLIEVDKLKRHLYIYLIDHLADYRRCNGLINAIRILAD